MEQVFWDSIPETERGHSEWHNSAYCDPEKAVVVHHRQLWVWRLCKRVSQKLFASKALTDTEKRYANIQKEQLEITFGVHKFHTWMRGRSFIVESDHTPLETIVTKYLANVPAQL